MKRLSLAATLALSATPAHAKDDKPSPARMKTIAQGLRDPAVRNGAACTSSTITVVIQILCSRVNAKNGCGGMTGSQTCRANIHAASTVGVLIRGTDKTYIAPQHRALMGLS